MRSYIAKTAVLEKTRNIAFKKISFPRPKKYQILIKIKYSGICGSQFMEYEGKRGPDKWLPHMFGHEAVGKVMEIGESVKNFKINDLVLLSWIKRKLRRKFDVSGSLLVKKKKINYGPVTTFSSYSLVDSNRVFKLPEYIEPKFGSLFGCSVPTGMGVVLNEAKPKKNSICLVMGVGAVGIFSALALKGIGIKNIICVDIDNNRLEKLKKIGFKNVLNFNEKNFQKKINSVTKNKKIDFCFECSGKANIITKSFELLNKNGKLFFVSHPNSSDMIKLKPHDLISGKKIFGSWGGSSNLDKDLNKFDKTINKSGLNLKNNCHFITFNNLNDIFKKKRKIMKPKIIIKF